jgi:hypothetical protein
VKKTNPVKIAGPFEAEALRLLRQVPGLEVVAQEPKGGADLWADFEYAGKRAKVAIEVKANANAATAWQLIQYAQAHPDRPLLLIAGHTTQEARHLLEDHGVAVIDGLGNAHVELPGLLLHLEGRGRPPRTAVGTPPTRLRGKAGRAAQLLLLHHPRAWGVQDLAAAADVAAGLAHRVLARLETEGIVVAEGSGPHRTRHVINPTALLDLWAEENVDRAVRTLAYLVAQTPRQLITELGTNLERAGVDYAITGTAGASLVAPFVTAVPVVDVWVAATASPEELYDGAHADPVTEGPNIVFRQGKDDTALAFREKHDNVWVADRFRLYADLGRDPRRGEEQAEHLRREVIGF